MMPELKPLPCIQMTIGEALDIANKFTAVFGDRKPHYPGHCGPHMAAVLVLAEALNTRPDGGDSLREAYNQADALVDLWVTCELKQGRKESAAEIIRQRTKYRAALAEQAAPVATEKGNVK